MMFHDLPALRPEGYGRPPGRSRHGMLSGRGRARKVLSGGRGRGLPSPLVFPLGESMSSLQGRVGVVTGASRGIGRAIALGLAREGCAIVVAAKSTESTDKLPGSVYSVAQEVEALGAPALPVPTDVRDADQLDSLATRTRERFGRIDVL